MEPLQRMNEKIELLLDELRRVNKSVVDASRKIDKLDRQAGGEDVFVELKEILSILQARVEGLEVFVEECRKTALEKKSQFPKDIDIWM